MPGSEQCRQARPTWAALMIAAGVAAAVVSTAPAVAQKAPPGPQGALISTESKGFMPPPGSPGATFSNPGKLEKGTGANKLDGGGQDGTKAVAPMFNKGSGNKKFGNKDSFQGGCATGTFCPSASDKWTGPTLTGKSGGKQGTAGIVGEEGLFDKGGKRPPVRGVEPPPSP